MDWCGQRAKMEDSWSMPHPLWMAKARGETRYKLTSSLKICCMGVCSKHLWQNKIQINFKFEILLDSDVGMGVCSKQFYYYLFPKYWAIKDKITIG